MRYPPRFPLLSWVTFLVLTVLAVVFYQERVAFLDASYQFVLLYTENQPVVQNHRYGAALTQFLPLLALRSGNLQLGMVLYSLSFVLLPFLGWIGLHYGLKERRFSMALPINAILMTLHTFFWMQSELLIAIDLTLIGGSLAYWVIHKDCQPWLLLAAIFMVLAILTHPLAFIAVAFTLCFIIISVTTSWQKRRIALVAAFLFALWVAKELLLPKVGYDRQNVALLLDFLHNPAGFWGYRSHRLFLEYIFTDYAVWTIALIGITIALRRQKAWRHLVLLYGGVLVTTSLVNATYTWRIDQFHIESFYRLPGMMVAIALALRFLPKVSDQKRIGWILLLGCLLRLAHITWTGAEYREHKRNLVELIHFARSQPSQAMVLPESILKGSGLGMTWAIPFETALLSRVMTPGKLGETILVLPDNRFEDFISPKGTFLGPFGSLDLLPQNRLLPFEDSLTYVKKDSLPPRLFGESQK